MSRYKFAAFTSLLVLSLTGIARAQDPVYNLASDWATSFPTTTVLNSATSATWGAGNVWSAGEMSFNWTNYGSQTENFTTYYSSTPTTASTTTNNTAGANGVGTFTYTVPFATYQFHPGTSINQQIGPVAGNLLQYGLKTANGSGSTIGLRSETGTGTSSSGTLNQLAAIESVIGSKGTEATGFTTTSYSATAQLNDGASSNNKSDAESPGVFYNYSTSNYTSSGIASLNVPSSVTNNTLLLSTGFGPTYVAWTAPSAGTISTLAMSVWELRESSGDDDEGFNNFYVVTSTNGGASVGSPLMQAISGTANGGYASIGESPGTQTATVGTVAYATSAPAGFTLDNNAGGVTWSASNIAVTAGEIFFFVGDPTHSLGNHTWPGSADPLALQLSLNFVPTPEPASMMLLVTGGIGLALAAWRKRRNTIA